MATGGNNNDDITKENNGGILQASGNMNTVMEKQRYNKERSPDKNLGSDDTTHFPILIRVMDSAKCKMSKESSQEFGPECWTMRKNPAGKDRLMKTSVIWIFGKNFS